MSKISAKGALIGGIADIVSTNILAIPVVMLAVRTIDLAHTRKDQLQSAITETIHGSPLLFSAQILIGIGCSILGGYLAARIAKQNPLVNGAASAWLCVLIGIYGAISGAPSGSLSMLLADLIVAPVAGVAGGYLRLQQVIRRPPEA